MHLAISAMLNGIRKGFLGTRRHPARFLGTRKESLAPNCILTNLRARSTSTDRRIPHQMAGFLRILRHPIARTRRSPAGFFGTRKESLAPDSILANLRAQSTSTDRRIPHQTAGFLRITRHPTALDRILRPPAKFSSRETLGGDLKFMQNSFLPHRFPVARDSAETSNSDRIYFRLTDSPSPETIGGDLKFRQNSFSPHRFPVARNSRQLPLSQADTLEDI